MVGPAKLHLGFLGSKDEDEDEEDNVGLLMILLQHPRTPTD